MLLRACVVLIVAASVRAETGRITVSGRTRPNTTQPRPRPKAEDTARPRPDREATSGAGYDAAAKAKRPREPKRTAQQTRPEKPKTEPTPETRRWLVKAERGMVASDSAEASQAGVEILKAGGNAVDAAVATSFALGVTRPHSTGLGGGGFAVIYASRTKETIAVDFREMAPGDATWDMFIQAKKEDPNGLPPSRYGGLAVGVPGLLAGATYLLDEFGTMRLGQVLAPAQRLAEDGFKADREYVTACRKAIKQFKDSPELMAKCGVLFRTVLARGRVPEPGQVIRRPELAEALRMLSWAGADALYDGQIGDAIVDAVKRAGGVISSQDLLNYRVRERRPVRCKYRDFEIVSMPPPSSGGIVIAEVLNILSNFPMSDLHTDKPSEAAHLFVEACKHAFADRSRWLGDPAYVDVPQQMLAGRRYADMLAKTIDPKKTKPTKGYGTTRLHDDAGTSHFCVVDADDNVVAWTETINLPFGSMVMTDRFGIILNNEMDDFSAEPGKPDAFGLRTGARNMIAPGKRPLSSMSPTIVLDADGRPILTLGASGGPRIISSVLNVLIDVLDYHMTLAEAIEANRIHHQWMPNEVSFRDPPDPALAAGLEEHGHRIAKRTTTGIVQAVEWQPDNTLLGASDPKKGGRPAGH